MLPVATATGCHGSRPAKKQIKAARTVQAATPPATEALERRFAGASSGLRSQSKATRNMRFITNSSSAPIGRLSAGETGIQSPIA